MFYTSQFLNNITCLVRDHTVAILMIIYIYYLLCTHTKINKKRRRAQKKKKRTAVDKTDAVINTNRVSRMRDRNLEHIKIFLSFLIILYFWFGHFIQMKSNYSEQIGTRNMRFIKMESSLRLLISNLLNYYWPMGVEHWALGQSKLEHHR